MKLQEIERLLEILSQAEQKFLLTKEIETDAIAPALRYKDKRNKEFAAFVCSVLAYGKVARTVCTQSSIDHISFFPVPTQSAEIGHLAALVMRIATGTQAFGLIGVRSVAHTRMRPTINTSAHDPISNRRDLSHFPCPACRYRDARWAIVAEPD